MAQPFVLRERWFDVSALEFEAFLRDYPRPLETRPPLPQKANYREWVDPRIGAWPGSAVAKSWKRGGCLGYQIHGASVVQADPSVMLNFNCDRPETRP
jgi:hypothetical protein